METKAVDTDRPSVLESRKGLCGPIVESLSAFTAISQEELGVAISFARVACEKRGVVVPEKQLLSAIKWAQEVHTNAMLLQFILAGVVQVKFDGGEAVVQGRDDTDMIDALVEYGLATTSEASP